MSEEVGPGMVRFDHRPAPPFLLARTPLALHPRLRRLHRRLRLLCRCLRRPHLALQLADLGLPFVQRRLRLVELRNYLPVLSGGV
jgi:hypothetical protein